MKSFGTNRPERSPADAHERYSELCALTTTGTMTDDEWREFQSHLAECAACKERVQQYRTIAKTGMSLLMPETDVKTTAVQNSWSVQSAKTELFARLARGEAPAQYGSRVVQRESRSWFLRWRWPFAVRQRAIVGYALASVLIFSAASLGFLLGRNRGQGAAQKQAELAKIQTASLRNQLDDALQQRRALDQDVSSRASEMGNLKQELQKQTAQVTELKTLRNQAQHDLDQQNSAVADLSQKNASMAKERDLLGRKLQDAERSLSALQIRLDKVQEERTQQLLRTASLETRIEELSSRLKEEDETLRDQSQFLASDRDVRELMGARDLYIADVFDIDREGSTRRPFGRIFYTHGKSLIFYAFDLDQQPDLRRASIFQAWGRRGPQDKRPLNMGIFYLDNERNRRWVLRFDDPKLLSEIDAVFVTVEPHKGGEKPSGKQLLFASLRAPANHP